MSQKLTPARRRLAWTFIAIGIIFWVSQFDWQQTSDDLHTQDLSDSPSAPYTFAMTWHPSFCKTKPKTPECQQLNSNSFSASNFVLHGLWPGPRDQVYCNSQGNPDAATATQFQAKRWRDLKSPELSKALKQQLKTKMPGSRSHLDRHEWIKHGTCFKPANPEAYFATSLAFLDEVNASPVVSLFRRAGAKPITLKTIEATFQKAFGVNARGKISLKCAKIKGKQTIIEVRLHLFGRALVNGTASGLSSMFGKNTVRSQCKSGIV